MPLVLVIRLYGFSGLKHKQVKPKATDCVFAVQYLFFGCEEYGTAISKIEGLPTQLVGYIWTLKVKGDDYFFIVEFKGDSD